MRILFLTDRLSRRGGADWHLQQVIAALLTGDHQITVAFGRSEEGAKPLAGTRGLRIRGLSSAVASAARIGALPDLLATADVVHIQNIMNPEVLRQATATGCAVVTVQDHRVFCPGPGKTLSGGSACLHPMSEEVCANCLPDSTYRARTIELTRQRLDALSGGRVIVFSNYMADELAAAGLPDSTVLPPWVEAGPPRRRPGDVFLLGGRLVAHKDPLTAWRAWRKARAPLPLQVAGEGPLATRLDGAVNLGWLDQRALDFELDRTRALLFPARWQEPFGILAVQALARGTPVIVADCGGTRDWSDAGCLRVPPGDTDAMVAAIASLAGDPAAALALGREGQAMVAERFSRSSLEPRLHDIHHAIASLPLR